MLEATPPPPGAVILYVSTHVMPGGPTGMPYWNQLLEGKKPFDTLSDVFSSCGISVTTLLT